MKKTIAILAVLAMTACTDAEMIQTAHNQCDQIGYPEGSPEYTECVERGFRGTKTAQDAAIAGTASAVLTGAILASFW
tara:strand:- start:225 stop:458 length:234 start_codon:yes stop_codon:yes gene_type:complete